MTSRDRRCWQSLRRANSLRSEGKMACLRSLSCKDTYSQRFASKFENFNLWSSVLGNILRIIRFCPQASRLPIEPTIFSFFLYEILEQTIVDQRIVSRSLQTLHTGWRTQVAKCMHGISRWICRVPRVARETKSHGAIGKWPRTDAGALVRCSCDKLPPDADFRFRQRNQRLHVTLCILAHAASNRLHRHHARESHFTVEDTSGIYIPITTPNDEYKYVLILWELHQYTITKNTKWMIW